VPTEQQLAGVISAVGGKSISAYVDTVDAAPLLDPLPKPGAIAKTTTLEKFGITEWQLANGVKVVVKPTDFREDEIVMRAVSYGGMSQAADADYVPASSATAVVNAGGLGRFSLVDFRKKMTGKQTSVSPFINQYEEGLSGTSTRTDLETMFQLIYLRFLQPRMDPTAFATFQGTMRSQLANQRNNPAFLFNEALTGALRNNHLRTRPITLEMVDQLNLEKSMAFYKDRFADASDFTFVFAGSIDLEAMKPLVERYLGALPSTGRKESWKDTGIRYATGVVEKRVEKGLEPQSRAALVFSGAYKDSQEQRIALRALADVLNARLREKLREDLGGTYGASVAASYTRVPVGEYAVTINFSCDPARTEELIKATFADIEDLKTNGPLEKQVNDTREKLIRDNETSVKQNAYWMTQLSLRYLSDEPLDTLFEMPEHYKKLTVASVHDAAKRYLNPANIVTVTMYPEKKSN
jgi:zinc protease